MSVISAWELADKLNSKLNEAGINVQYYGPSSVRAFSKNSEAIVKIDILPSGFNVCSGVLDPEGHLKTEETSRMHVQKDTTVETAIRWHIR